MATGRSAGQILDDDPGRWQRDPRDAMTPAGLYATYQGCRYPVVTAGGDDVWLRVTRETMHALAGPGLLVRDESEPHGPTVKVRRTALDALVHRSVFAQWRGAEVSVEQVRGEVVTFYSNGGPVWAAVNGVEGDQHDGWWGEAPFSELTDVREEESELPLSRGW